MIHNRNILITRDFTFNFSVCLQRKDLLQLMIDASDSETQKGLEKGEIVIDSVGFILAGYETTSTALTFATYLLGANPEAQERLANEIHEYFAENPVSEVTICINVLLLYTHYTDGRYTCIEDNVYIACAGQVHV